MGDPARFDLFSTLRQCAIIAGLVFVPPLAIAGLSPRRRWLLPLALACCGAAWLILFVALLLGINNIGGPLPYQPFRVGPSTFALWDLLELFRLTLWLPAVVLYVVQHYLLGRRRYRYWR